MYLIIAMLWIAFSDLLFAQVFGNNRPLLQLLMTLKGWLFVLATALLLHYQIRHALQQQRQAEQALFQREAQFRYLFMLNPLPMWVYDEQTLQFLDVNETAIRHYGYYREEFLAMTIKDIRPPEELPRLEENLKQRRNLYHASEEWRHRVKDGSIRVVDITTHQLIYMGRPAVLVVINDVTMRAQMRNSLERTTRMLEELIKASPIGIVVVNRESKVKLWNPAAEALYGWKVNEVLDTRIPIIPTEQRTEAQAIMTRLLQGEVIKDLEVQRHHKDGRVIELRISYAPLYIEREQPTQVSDVLSMITDITELKRLEADRVEKEKLSVALSKEIEVRKLRDRFVSMISHEFRIPLTTINSSASMLKDYWERLSPEKRQHHTHLIITQVGMMVELLEEMLDVLRNESLTLDFQPQSNDLIGFLREVIAEMQNNVQKTHTLQLDTPLESLTLSIDRKLMRHALTNLIGNAVKYSPKGGTIDLIAQIDQQQLAITIRDQGIGIPTEDLPTLFDPFKRGSNVRGIPGTGLGLLIVKQAVELHGGRIDVQSELEVGTTFTLYFPLQSTESNEQAAIL
ncbi:MAG: PAS domain S-box protein [Anaerolineae bacterium]|nr:PAS domain S-box protein [Anaerolineae bacterium]